MSLAPDRRADAAHTWVWRLARLAVRTFYHVARVGPPLPDGGLLLVANHPNTLLDPAVIQATAGRPVRFLAKSTLFRRHPMSLFVRHSGAIPVFRRMDDGEDTIPKIVRFVADHDVIVVAVDGYVAEHYEGFYGGSPWDVREDGGDYDFGEYFLELVAHVDASYRTLTGRRHRATSGLSM